jgi:hypothetical protein
MAGLNTRSRGASQLASTPGMSTELLLANAGAPNQRDSRNGGNAPQTTFPPGKRMPRPHTQASATARSSLFDVTDTLRLLYERGSFARVHFGGGGKSERVSLHAETHIRIRMSARGNGSSRILDLNTLGKYPIYDPIYEYGQYTCILTIYCPRRPCWRRSGQLYRHRHARH